jgi:hypothetical protein
MRRVFMSLKSIIGDIEKAVSNNVILANWLQYVGGMLVLGGAIFVHHVFGIPAIYIGVGLNLTGLFFNKLYPS